MTRYSKTLRPLALPRRPVEGRPRRPPGRISSAHRRLGPEIMGQLVHDYEAGESTVAPCATYGIGKGTVLRLLAEHGTEMRRQGLAADLLPEATRLYFEQGMSLIEVGDRLGCSGDAVRFA